MIGASLRLGPGEKQKANSHEGITWSEIENKTDKLKRSIVKWHSRCGLVCSQYIEFLNTCLFKSFQPRKEPYSPVTRGSVLNALDFHLLADVPDSNSDLRPSLGTS